MKKSDLKDVFKMGLGFALGSVVMLPFVSMLVAKVKVL